MKTHAYGNLKSGSILPMSTLLPQEQRDALVAASKVDSRIDYGESPSRLMAVDAAAAKIRAELPDMFGPIV